MPDYGNGFGGHDGFQNCPIHGVEVACPVPKTVNPGQPDIPGVYYAGTWYLQTGYTYVSNGYKFSVVSPRALESFKAACQTKKFLWWTWVDHWYVEVESKGKDFALFTRHRCPCGKERITESGGP